MGAQVGRMNLDEVEREARERGYINGALHRGELWPIGTLVRWKGPNSRTTYRIVGHRSGGLPPNMSFGVELASLNPTKLGPAKLQRRNPFWTSIEFLRKVSH